MFRQRATLYAEMGRGRSMPSLCSVLFLDPDHRWLEDVALGVSADFVVSASESLWGGLALVRKERFDLVVLSDAFVTAGVDEAVLHLQRACVGKAPRVFVAAAKDNMFDCGLALDAGADLYFGRPDTVARLRDALVGGLLLCGKRAAEAVPPRAVVDAELVVPAMSRRVFLTDV